MTFSGTTAVPYLAEIHCFICQTKLSYLKLTTNGSSAISKVMFNDTSYLLISLSQKP